MKVVKVSQVPVEASGGKLFTGPITRQPIVSAQDSKQFAVHQVNFPRGVRNKFHTHTNDQVLVITAGKGICATEGQEVTVFPGDVVLFPAGEKHWHGATADSAFSHIYITGADTTTTQIEE